VWLILDVGVVAMLGLGNTLWEKRDYQVPYMKVEAMSESGLAVGVDVSSRTAMVDVGNMNPQTARWGVYAAKEWDRLRVEAGHVSEHEVADTPSHVKGRPTESYNYVKVGYKVSVWVD